MEIEQEERYHLQEAHGSLLRLYIFFLLMFQSLFQLSDMVKFLSMFFLTLNKTFKSLPESLVSKLPCSVQDAREFGSNRNTLQQFVCCPSCHSIYKQEDCILEDSSGEKISKKCSYRKFPNHPQPQHRHTCDTLLMKRVKLSSGRFLLTPRIIYCYKSIIESLQEMLKREGFSTKM